MRKVLQGFAASYCLENLQGREIFALTSLAHSYEVIVGLEAELPPSSPLSAYPLQEHLHQRHAPIRLADLIALKAIHGVACEGLPLTRGRPLSVPA